MVSLVRQDDISTVAECPKCRNRDGIKDGGPGLQGFRAYDVRSDTYGQCRCPRCGYKAKWIDFHLPVSAVKK